MVVGRAGGVVVSLDEVIAAVRSNVSVADEARGAVEATKTKISEVRSVFAGLGADAKASEAAQLLQTAEQAQGLWESVKQKLEELGAQAQAMKTLSGAGGGSGVVPASESGIRYETGSPVKPPEGGPDEPGALRQELKNPDDADEKRSRLQRLGRAGVRNASDLKSQGDDLAKSVNATISGFKPPEGTSATVQVPNSPPEQPRHAPDDPVGTAIIMGVAAFEAATRLMNKRERKKRDG